MGRGAEDADVVVVGAGFAGLALAHVAAAAGMSVIVLERRSETATEGAGVTLQANGLSVLERLGVLDEALAVGHRVTVARQCTPSGRVLAEFHYDEIDHRHAYLLPVERAPVVSLLARRLPAGATLRLDAPVEALLHEGGVVSRGEPVRARWVVGADGVNSVVREALGARSRDRTGPYRYVVGLAPVAPRDEVAHVYCGDGWADGVMPNHERTYFFDYLTGESAGAVERRDFDAWRAAYARRIPDGERIAGALRSFDDVSVLSGRTHRAVPRARREVVLIGDAAAAVHPHSGQGANLALEEGLALGRALASRDDAAIEACVRALDARRRRMVPWSILVGRSLDAPNLAWRAVRAASYAPVRVPFARRALMRRHMGIDW